MAFYWYTQLNAEDGTYLKKHDSEEAALEYLDYQFGIKPEKDFLGRFHDDYGRSMTISKLTPEEANDLHGDWL